MSRVALSLTLLAVCGCLDASAPATEPVPIRLLAHLASARTLSYEPAALRPKVILDDPRLAAFEGPGLTVTALGTSVVFDPAVAPDPAVVSQNGPPAAGATAHLTLNVAAGVEYVLELRSSTAFTAVRVVATAKVGVETVTPEVGASVGTEGVRYSYRSTPSDGTLHLELAMDQRVVLHGLVVREAAAANPFRLTPALTFDLRGVVRIEELEGDVAVQHMRDALLASGPTTFEWPISPVFAAGARLEVSTTVVPRALERPRPLALTVSTFDGADWTARATRTLKAGDIRYEPWVIELGAAKALRLSTEVVGEGESVTAAWATPTLFPARPVTTQRKRRPDVFLFTIDALRPDHLGAYGDKRGLTPALDAFAARGTLFEEARSNRGETWVSLSSIAHGARPETIGVFDRGHVPHRGLPTIAERFAQVGYRTALVGNFLMVPGQLGPFDLELQSVNDEVNLRRLRAVLAEDRDEPVFVFMHLAATHYPYQPADRFRRPESGAIQTRESFATLVHDAGPPSELERTQRLYEDCVRQTDALLGELIETLPETSLIAIAADHGSTRGENGLWFLHSTHDRSVLRVPLLLAGQGVPAGRRVAELTPLIDLGPTLLDLASADATGFEGRSLRERLEGVRDEGRTHVVMSNAATLLSVENESYKLMANPNDFSQVYPEFQISAKSRPRVSLYAPARDPSERDDLADRAPLIAGELWQQATKARATVERSVTPEARRLLEQAGYAAPGAH